MDLHAYPYAIHTDICLKIFGNPVSCNQQVCRYPPDSCTGNC
jgi:hypothetical protein